MEKRTKTWSTSFPTGWEITRLGDTEYFQIIMGQSPPSESYNESGIGTLFMQGCSEFGRIYPSPHYYCSKPLRIAEPGDILISVRAPVGEVNLNNKKI